MRDKVAFREMHLTQGTLGQGRCLPFKKVVHSCDNKKEQIMKAPKPLVADTIKRVVPIEHYYHEYLFEFQNTIVGEKIIIVS